MQITYRQLQSGDQALVRRVGRDSYVPYYPHIWKPGGIDWYMEQCFGQEILDRELPDSNVEYWLAEDVAGQPVGFLKFVLQKEAPALQQQNAFYLEKIYLLPAFMGKGIGQILLDFAHNRAKSLGRDIIWLMVLKCGPVEAYTRAGYRIIGETRWDFDLLLPEQRGGWIMARAVERQ